MKTDQALGAGWHPSVSAVTPSRGAVGERGIKSAYRVLVHVSDWQPAQSGFMPRKPLQQERLGLK
ncbi:MAG: hypothetical protein KBD82_14150 [Rhodoferax sp.]|nr:hypothetical protein [Rhodoferax sp.]